MPIIVATIRHKNATVMLKTATTTPVNMIETTRIRTESPMQTLIPAQETATVTVRAIIDRQMAQGIAIHTTTPTTAITIRGRATKRAMATNVVATAR